MYAQITFTAFANAPSANRKVARTIAAAPVAARKPAFAAGTTVRVESILAATTFVATALVSSFSLLQAFIG